MSTATATPITAAQFLTAAGNDPEKALQLAIAETEKSRLEQARITERLSEAKEMADVHFGPQGIDADNAAALWRIAVLFSRSDLVPEHFRKRAENCFIALQMAKRMRVDPFALMQKLYVVHGKPGLEAQLAIAMLNASGKIVGEVDYRFGGDGDDYGCECIVTSAATGKEVVGPKITWQMVKDEGWLSKSGSKWKTMSAIMFPYRSAIFLIRTKWPELLMGLQTNDELEDVDPKGDKPKTNESRPTTLDGLKEMLGRRGTSLPSEATDCEQSNGKTASNQSTADEAANATGGKEPSQPKDTGRPADSAVEKAKSDVDAKLDTAKEQAKEEIKTAVDRTALPGKPPFPADIGPLADIDDELENMKSALQIAEVVKRRRAECQGEQVLWLNRAKEFYIAQLKAKK